MDLDTTKKKTLNSRKEEAFNLESLKTLLTRKTLISQQLRPLDTQINSNLTTKIAVAMTMWAAKWTKFLTPHQGTAKCLWGVCCRAGGVI